MAESQGARTTRWFTSVTDKIYFPSELIRNLMLSEPELGCYDPDVLQQVPVQATHMLKEELQDLTSRWHTYWRQYSDEVRAPVMYALGQ